jgi:hypothetical protein
MRSLIDWLSELNTPKRNPYLRLSETDRDRLGVRFILFVIAVGALFTIWRLLIRP